MKMTKIIVLYNIILLQADGTTPLEIVGETHVDVTEET